MAYTAITVQTIPDGGAALSETAIDAANGNAVPLDGKTWLYVANVGIQDIAVSVLASGVIDGVELGSAFDCNFSFAGAGSRLIPPLNEAVYAVPAGTNAGQALVTYSGDGTTDGRIAAFRFARRLDR